MTPGRGVAVERRFRFPNRPRWATMRMLLAAAEHTAPTPIPGASMSGICTVDRRVPARAEVAVA